MVGGDLAATCIFLRMSGHVGGSYIPSVFFMFSFLFFVYSFFVLIRSSTLVRFLFMISSLILGFCPVHRVLRFFLFFSGKSLDCTNGNDKKLFFFASWMVIVYHPF